MLKWTMNTLSPDQNKSCKTNTKGGVLTLIATLVSVQVFSEVRNYKVQIIKQ